MGLATGYIKIGGTGRLLNGIVLSNLGYSVGLSKLGLEERFSFKDLSILSSDDLISSCCI